MNDTLLNLPYSFYKQKTADRPANQEIIFLHGWELFWYAGFLIISFRWGVI